MSFKDTFSNIFNKKDKQIIDPDLSTKLIFENEVEKIVKRYSHNNEILKVKEAKTDKDILFADFYPDEYSQWLKIRTLSDRRVIIYSLLDNLLWNKVQLWEKAERLIEARLPLKAYELLNEVQPDENENLEMYYSIFAKTNIVMREYDKALLQIIKGLNNFPDSKSLKIQLADYYYSIALCDKYNEVIVELVKNLEPNNASDMNIVFDGLFSYNDGQLRSMAFAVNLGFSLSDPEQIKIFWERAADEFYFHPVFRLDHARYILENRNKEDIMDIAKAFVKYYYLLEEMPWQKEAAINALSLAETLGIKDERYNFISNIIEKNNWNSNGMNDISV